MRTFLIACAMALAAAGCAMTVPMEQFHATIGQHQRSTDEVAAAIERALAARNWVVTARRPGEVDASLIGAEFRADITIPYTATSYELRYRDSQGLDYTGSLIHRHYINWMVNLQVSIERELIAAPPLAAPAAAPAAQPQPETPGAGQ
ncbi:MAG TPA: hypothetical protein PLN53_00270 [Terricaulis sp.]|nr:hypothetical protein [Terricaulis sp.]